MTAWSTYGGDTVTAGERFVLMRPKYGPPTPRPVVIFAHGAGSDSTLVLTGADTVEPTARAIVNDGSTLLSCDLGGTGTWGNTTVKTRLTEAWTYAQTIPGVKTGKVLLLGTSMGGLTSLAWAAANTSKVGGVVGLIPVLDLTDVHTNNRGGTTAAINAAYGGAYSQATYGAAHNPVTMAAAGVYSSIPILIYYGATDAICLPARAAAFATSAGAEAHMVTGGHDSVSYGNVDVPHVVDWLAAHG